MSDSNPMKMDLANDPTGTRRQDAPQVDRSDIPDDLRKKICGTSTDCVVDDVNLWTKHNGEDFYALILILVASLPSNGHTVSRMVSLSNFLWICTVFTVSTASQMHFNCTTARQKVCEITNIIITEYTDVSEWDFPDNPDIAFGSHPLPDESTIITMITREVSEKLTNAQNIEMQNVSLMSFFLWEHLISLDVSYNYLSELIVDPTAMYNLKSLNMKHNRLQSIDFLKGLYKLRDLDLSNNYLEKIDLSILDPAKDLATLKLSNNRIRTITTSFGDMLHLPRLTVLMLDHNQLTILDASRWQFNVLQDFFLSSNRLSYISMCEIQNSFPRLQSLYLDGNNWECSHLNSTVAQLHELGVKLVNHNSHTCMEAIDGICCS
ncbi:protein flightless-1-like [Armigeres subalbatus]|uniref:protein flightless-1-like n=1 Tax=Armigeres subalbatus TaxID=124917 RepID=UPI002ED53B25